MTEKTNHLKIITRGIRPLLASVLLFILVISLSACRDLLEDNPSPPFDPPLQKRIDQSWDPFQHGKDLNIQFSHLSLEDGLSQSTITSILQDSQGFMWFGTMDGLNRYDGYEFTVFKHDPTDPNSLSQNHILSLYEDSQGVLWVGTEGGALDRYDPNQKTFIHFGQDPGQPLSLSSDHVTAIFEDKGGNFWIGTSNGLNKFDRETGEFTQYPNEFDPTFESFGSNYITTIFEDKAGTLWIGTFGGLLTFEPENGTYSQYLLVRLITERIPEGPERAKIQSILQDEAGRLWIGTRGEGLFAVDPQSGRMVRYLYERNNPHSLSSNTVYSLLRDQFGTLWIGTENGLDRLDPDEQQFTHYRNDPDVFDSLSDNEIRSIFADEAGILWIGTSIGGLNKYDPFKIKFDHIQAGRNGEDGLSHPQVWTFYQDDSDNLWIGTSAGLDKLDLRTGQMTHFNHDPDDPGSLSNDYVTKIIEDKHGTLWFATQGGLNRLDRGEESFDRYLPDADDLTSLSSPFINDIHEDESGYIWIGTAGSGFDRFDRTNNRFTNFHYQIDDAPADTLPENTILSFFEDTGATLWVGTMGGLIEVDLATDSFSHYRHDPEDPSSPSHNIINAIHRDSRGTLWLATAAGLDWFDPAGERFGHFREEDGLPNNTVLGILEDSEGYLWLSTNRGLSKFNPEDGSFRNYDTSDGLQSLEFNRGAFYQNEYGEMFFGGINGFNLFHPDDVHDNPYAPPLVLTDFLIGNESVGVGPDSPFEQTIQQMDRIVLPGQDNVFTFELASLHYGAPEEINYAYIMEGFDSKWNLIGNRRFATYTNLPPGEYTFRAIGSNSDGVWNEEGLAVNISIPFPFWQSWWFAALLLVLVVGSIVAGFRLRTRSIEARTRELEEQVTARTIEVEARREIAEGLREILILLNSNRSLEESLHYIVSQAARLTEAEDAIIFRYDVVNPMTIVATNPGGQIRYSPDAAINSVTKIWAEEDLLNQKPLVIPDFVVYWLAHPNVRTGKHPSYRAVLGVPLFIGAEIYGGLIMFYHQERAFSDEDLELGFTFADQATLAIANARLREQAEQTAVAMERSRLARELHDAVTQTIFSASLIAETVAPVWESDQEEGRKLLQELRQLTRGALAEMRTLLLELRPSALEETSLPDLLNQLAEAVVGRTGVPVKTQIEPTCEIPTNVKVALYRIAQESLNNVMKHARASQVKINLCGCSDKKGVRLSVWDDGRGFDLDEVPPDRLGLAIIRERAQAIGADLSVESHLGQGSRISVKWYEVKKNAKD